MANENIKQRNQQAAGTQAVMGGTEESVAAAKAANNQALADATSQIAVNGDRRKDQIESQYLSTKADLNNQLNNLEQAKSTAITQAVQGAAQSASNIASLF
jgi:molecular chaperone GrpE (heat shock protein)